jgi:hypothetical protein
MKRYRTSVKSSHCEGCQKEFNKDLPYNARNRCNACYQRDYNKLKHQPRSIIKNCVLCNLEFGSLNEKGKLVRKGAQNHCKRCYANAFNKLKSSTCKGCGSEMATKRLSLCPICKQNETGSKRWKRKKRSPHIITDNELIESIRRLLVRYKYGTNTHVDALRVIDVYLDVSDNTNILDNFREDFQIIEMLKWLKLTYDYNLDLMMKRKQAERIKQEKKAKYYKYVKKDKPKITEDITTYMKIYREVNSESISAYQRTWREMNKKEQI